MTPPDPLDALWRADEPPPRDYAFTAAALARAGAIDRRTLLLRRTLTGLGVGAAVAGAMLVLHLDLDAWTLAVVGTGMTGAFWALTSRAPA